PGGRGRVAEVTAHGARIVVESGRVHVRVEHLPKAEWSVVAGPYVVMVTGTEFDVGWSGERDELEVDLAVGSVIVRGPLAPGGVGRRGGRGGAGRLGEGELRIWTEVGSAARPGGLAPSSSPPQVDPPASSAAALAPPSAAPRLSDRSADEPPKPPRDQASA